MSQVQLWKNTIPLKATVTLLYDKPITLTASPGQLYYDKNGYVRFFSMRHKGSIYNLQLLPVKLLSNSVIQYAKTWLISLGLNIIGGVVIEEIEGKVIDDIARYIAKKVAKDFIVKNFFDGNSIQNCVDYDIVTGRLIVTKPLKVNF